MIFVPTATSKAGLSLTMANWTELGVKALSFSLESLLIKPGLPLLKTIPDIRHYLGWNAEFILNAQSLSLDKNGSCSVTSLLDGSKIKLNKSEVMELILHLRPDKVLLPKSFLPPCSDNWDETIRAFIHLEDWNQEGAFGFGRYVLSKQTKEYEPLLDKPLYIIGRIPLPLVENSSLKSNAYLEAPVVLEEALQGKVYTRAGFLDLMDKRYEKDFEPIDTQCVCPSCKKGLTRAYLHHLLLHTPLLCHRFLIGHNVFFQQILLAP